MATNTDAATVIPATMSTKKRSSAATVIPATMSTNTDAATVIPATMSTNTDAATVILTMEEALHRLQSSTQTLCLELLRSSAFSRTTWILGFVGIVWICVTLLKIPPVDGGLPLPLKHEVLISFAVGGAFGIVLNLFVFLMHLLLWINARKMNNTQPPNLEVTEKCFYTQTKIMGAVTATEKCCFLFGSFFWVYVFVVALFGIVRL